MYLCAHGCSIQLGGPIALGELSLLIDKYGEPNFLNSSSGTDEIHYLISRGELNGSGIGFIAVYNQRNGAIPHLFVDEREDHVWFGVNEVVYCCNTNSWKTKFEIKLNGIFRSLVKIQHADIYLLFHEIGACAVDAEGKTLWKCETGIITTISIEKEVLIIESMDEAPVSVSVRTGKLQ